MPLETSRLPSDTTPTILTFTTTEVKVSRDLIHNDTKANIAVYFIMQDYERAIADYVKSTELDGNFVFSQVQHAVALYKQEHIASCMAAFRRIMKQFPDRCEPPNY